MVHLKATTRNERFSSIQVIAYLSGWAFILDCHASRRCWRR